MVRENECHQDFEYRRCGGVIRIYQFIVRGAVQKIFWQNLGFCPNQLELSHLDTYGQPPLQNNISVAASKPIKSSTKMNFG